MRAGVARNISSDRIKKGWTLFQEWTGGQRPFVHPRGQCGGLRFMDTKLPRMAERIEFWATTKLLPYEKNPRLHSDEQISQIAASFIRFGMEMPILVDSAAGVIAGHGRLEAAKLVGLKKVPVVILDGLSEEEKSAYVIADNKLTC